MWPPSWLRSPTRVRAHSSHAPPSPKPPSSPSPSPRFFSCSSLKDIQTLLTEEPACGPISEPASPKAPSIFHRTRSLRYWAHRSKPAYPRPDDDHLIVFYFTSLRVVRKTYEDCRAVRSILRGLRVPVDERDLSMDGKYLDEIHAITGSNKPLTLPVVFIGGKCVGGAEELKEMNESGELKKLIGGLPLPRPLVDSCGPCDLCGGLRFVLCEQCSGSHKIYSEKCGFRSCPCCNINGLISCPSCVTRSRRHR